MDEKTTTSPRKKAKYTVNTHKHLALEDGLPIVVRIDLSISVPHDAVLETSVESIYLQARRGDLGLRPIGPPRPRHEHTPEALP